LPSIGTATSEDQSIRDDGTHHQDVEARIMAAMGNIRMADRYGRRGKSGSHRRQRLPWSEEEMSFLVEQVTENGPAWQLIWDLNQEKTPVIHPRRTPVDYKDKAMIYKKDMIVYVSCIICKDRH
jgi:hypothetical protein